jgi:hypothetical protein
MPPARLTFLPGLALTLLLGACSVATPPSVAVGTRPAQAAGAITALRLDTPAPADPATARFTAALATALARHGVRLAEDSPVVLTLALSQRPADIGVSQQPGETWLSLPRKRGPLDACRAQRLAVRLVAREEARADPAFAASGGFDYCRLDPADLDALADRFADALARG